MSTERERENATNKVSANDDSRGQTGNPLLCVHRVSVVKEFANMDHRDAMNTEIGDRGKSSSAPDERSAPGLSSGGRTVSLSQRGIMSCTRCST